MRSRSSAVLYLFFAFIFVSTSNAQTFRGSIQGTITDSTGAAIPGAQVKVFSPGTGLNRTVSTNDLGGYVASELPLGTYSITIARDGFRTTTLTNIPVSVGSASRADARLATGGSRKQSRSPPMFRWWRRPTTRQVAPSKHPRQPSCR